MGDTWEGGFRSFSLGLCPLPPSPHWLCTLVSLLPSILPPSLSPFPQLPCGPSLRLTVQWPFQLGFGLGSSQRSQCLLLILADFSSSDLSPVTWQHQSEQGLGHPGKEGRQLAPKEGPAASRGDREAIGSIGTLGREESLVPAKGRLSTSLPIRHSRRKAEPWDSLQFFLILCTIPLPRLEACSRDTTPCYRGLRGQFSLAVG